MGENNLIRVGFASSVFAFPRGSQLLLTGPPGHVKVNLALRYLCDRLLNGEPGVYTTMRLKPQQVRELASQYCGKAAKELRVVDGVSCITAQPPSEPFALRSLSDLNVISLVLLQAIEGLEQGHLCIDSLSTLMTYSPPTSVLKFTQVLGAKAKALGVTSLYLLEGGVHSPEIVASLRLSLDGVIETRELEVEGCLRHLVRLAYVRGVRVDSRWLLYADAPNQLLRPYPAPIPQSQG